MMLEELRAHPEDEQPLVIEFRPWRWSDPDRVSRVFFHEIQTAILRASKWRQKFRRLAYWHTYTSRLIDSPSSLGDLVLKAFAGASALGLISAKFLDVVTGWLADSAAVIGAILLFVTFAGDIAKKLLGFVELDKKTTEELKEIVAGELRKLDRAILVVVDDIDRSTDEEIQTIIQHVKCNVDFPRLIYFLLLDQHIVQKALQSQVGGAGKKYLEKVIEISLTLPRAEDSKIEKVLVDGLNAILGSFAEREHGFDDQRWSGFLLDGVHPFLRNLRDVNRFLGNLALWIGSFKTRHTLEVNPIDLIGLQVLRLFEPAVFNALADNKSLLIGARRNTTRPERLKGQLDGLLGLTEQETRSATTNLLRLLFPMSDHYLEGIVGPHEIDTQWVIDRRVCAPEYFDRYFLFAVPANEISRHEFSNLLGNISNRDALEYHFQELKERKLLGAALRLLDYEKEQIPFQHASQFLPAIFDLGEELNGSTFVQFGLNDYVYSWRIPYWYLRTESDLEKRDLAFVQAIQSSKGLSVPASLLALEQKARKGDSTGQLESYLSDAGFHEATNAWLEKIRESASDGTLIRNENLAHLWWRWHEFATSEDPVTWLNFASKQQALTVDLITGFASESIISSAKGSYRKWRFDLDSIAAFIDIETLSASALSLDVDSLPFQKKESVVAFNRAVERRTLGRPTPDFEDA